MNFVVDDIGEVVRLMQLSPLTEALSLILASSTKTDVNTRFPFYDYGHRLEMAKKLLEADKDMVRKYIKYPLIMLRLPINELVEADIVTYRLNLAIVHLTKPEYTAQQRMEKTFKPILASIYDSFFEQLRLSGRFIIPRDKPPHGRILRMYYGTQLAEGTDKNIFNDPLDAIEITDLKISSYIKNC